MGQESVGRNFGLRLKAVKAGLISDTSSDVRGGLLLFAVFSVIGLVIAFKSLTYDFFWDDLHLVRPYSGSEILQAFSGNWDPDGIETPGYRPLTTIFNHVRGSILGENVIAQRLLMIALFAGFLSFLGLAARRLGIPLWQSAIAGAISLVARDNLWNLVWISDGVHAFAGLFFFIALYLYLRHMEHPAQWRFVLSLVCVLAALLTREETLSLLPVIPAAAFLSSGLSRLELAEISINRFLELLLQRQFSKIPVLFPRPMIKTILRYCMILAFMVVGYWVLRQSLVDVVPRRLTFQGWRLLVELTLFPMGRKFQERTWLMMLVSLVTIAVFVLPTRAKLQAGFWLGCMVLSASIGLVLARVNILLFPISFFGLFLAIVLGEFGKTSRGGAVYSGVFLLVLLFWSGRLNLIQQESLHPSSIQYLELNAEFIWEPYTYATIPEERRERMIQRYEELGVHSADDFAQALPLWIEAADSNGLDRPNKDGDLFIPRIAVLAP